MNCTRKVFKIWPHVGTCIGSNLKLPHTGLDPDVYKVTLVFLGSALEFIVDAVDGTLSIPTDKLNEQHYYEGWVQDSVGVIVPFNVDYHVFAFQTKITRNVE